MTKQPHDHDHDHDEHDAEEFDTVVLTDDEGKDMNFFISIPWNWRALHIMY